MTLNHPTLVIIADHNEQARDIVARWQLERTVPAFTLLNSELWNPGLVATCDLAIVFGVREDRATPILAAFDAQGIPCIYVAEKDAAYQHFRSNFPRVLLLHHHDNWLDSLVVLAGEVLRRSEAGARVKKAEATAQLLQRQAALGKYMLDTRHSFNNALTSVLGNAELMLLEPSLLPTHIREQVDTIHSMALRLHEMMQRFSSLETEMTFADRESQIDTKPRLQAYVSGS
jgi:signal transduction histidine kinase